MTIREGKWKCTYCEALNRGRDLKCAGCGAVREQDVRFIYDENAPEIIDEAELQAAKAGPEWLCETCGASNSVTREDCRQCGAPRGASPSREVNLIGAPAVPPPPAPPTPAVPVAKRLPRPVIIALMAALAVIGVFACGFVALVFYLLRTHEARLVVADVRWERSVEVEELRTLTEQAWEDQLPANAREVSRRREVHHTDRVQTGTRPVTQTYTEEVQVGTKRVKTGTRDLGNGYFEDVYQNEPVYENRKGTRTVSEPIYRDQPVYKNRVTYQIERWVTAGTEQAQKADNSPVWPAISVGPRRRAGKRTARYLVRLRDTESGKTYEREVEEAEFTRFTPGITCRAQINNLGEIVELTVAGAGP